MKAFWKDVLTKQIKINLQFQNALQDIKKIIQDRKEQHKS